GTSVRSDRNRRRTSPDASSAGHPTAAAAVCTAVHDDLASSAAADSTADGPHLCDPTGPRTAHPDADADPDVAGTCVRIRSASGGAPHHDVHEHLHPAPPEPDPDRPA